MGRWYTEEEKAERESRLAEAKAAWEGRTLDYGDWTRRVVDVQIDDRDRLVLYARGSNEDGLTPELACHWETSRRDDIKTYGATDAVTDAIPAGCERISLVEDPHSGHGYYQVERADGSFYQCDTCGDEVELGDSVLLRVLADVPADDADAFFAAITATAKRREEG